MSMNPDVMNAFKKVSTSYLRKLLNRLEASYRRGKATCHFHADYANAVYSYMSETVSDESIIQMLETDHEKQTQLRDGIVDALYRLADRVKNADLIEGDISKHPEHIWDSMSAFKIDGVTVEMGMPRSLCESLNKDECDTQKRLEMFETLIARLRSADVRTPETEEYWRMKNGHMTTREW